MGCYLSVCNVIAIIFFSAILFLSLGLNKVTLGQYNDLMYGPDETVHNMSQIDWAAAYWNYLYKFTVDNNPRTSYTPEMCNMHQSGPVWFLPDDENNRGDVEKRDCTVPYGKSIVIQIVGSGCVPPEDPDLISCANWILGKAKFSVTIDGQKVIDTYNKPNSREYFLEPEFKTITVGENNIHGVSPAGVYNGTVAGYFAFIKPLPIGEHTIYIKENVESFDNKNTLQQRHVNLEYKITVKEI